MSEQARTSDEWTSRNASLNGQELDVIFQRLERCQGLPMKSLGNWRVAHANDALVLLRGTVPRILQEVIDQIAIRNKSGGCGYSTYRGRRIRRFVLIA